MVSTKSEGGFTKKECPKCQSDKIVINTSVEVVLICLHCDYAWANEDKDEILYL